MLGTKGVRIRRFEGTASTCRKGKLDLTQNLGATKTLLGLQFQCLKLDQVLQRPQLNFILETVKGEVYCMEKLKNKAGVMGGETSMQFIKCDNTSLVCQIYLAG